jgi:hypothetical protein
MGSLKLIELHEGARLGLGPAIELFDVVADPGETKDLSASQPSRAAEMRALLAAWRQDVRAQEMSIRN